jgi:hypothetical protein
MWSMPWINTAEYSISGLIFNGIGCLFWLVAYSVLVYNIYKKKFVEMPAYVAGANFGWEFVYSFIYHPTTGLIYALAYIGAFFLDCYIFFNLLRYGEKQPMTSLVRKYFKPLALFNFIFWILWCYFFIYQGFDNGIGANSGYIINMILSITCLAMLLQMNDPSKFSIIFAWCKMLGTGFMSVSAIIFYPDNHLVQVMAVTCFVVDSIFIGVLTQKNGKLL